eukprot:4163224-Alexandrium_andersonii.AAC.2
MRPGWIGHSLSLDLTQRMCNPAGPQCSVNHGPQGNPRGGDTEDGGFSVEDTGKSIIGRIKGSLRALTLQL